MDNVDLNKISTIDETPPKKNKFTIVKNIELTDNNKKNVSEEKKSIKELPTPILRRQTTTDWNFDTSSTNSEFDFKVNNSKTNLPTEFNETNTNFNNEDDDVFDDRLPLNIEKTNYRDLEGQDTITSLSNNIYLKQLAKIRNKKSSFKSTSSKKSDEDINVKNLNPTVLEFNRSTSIESSSSRTNIRSLFKSRSSFTSQKSLNVERLENNSLLPVSTKSSLTDEKNKSSLDITQLGASETFVNLINNKPRKFSIKGSLINIENDVNNTTSKSEQVFQVLKVVIDNNKDSEMTNQFIEQVIKTVKLQQLKKKRKKDIEKRACLALELLVFISILLMSILLIKNVLLQLRIIDSKFIYFKRTNNSIHHNVTNN